MATFIDTNVLVDLFSNDPDRSIPCADKLTEAKARGRVLISDLVFSEFSVAMNSLEEAEQVVKSLDLTRVRCSAAGLFRAGKAFKVYKETNSGPKLNVLPDFVIGAHAVTEAAPLITSDTNRMQTYFPDLEIIKP